MSPDHRRVRERVARFPRVSGDEPMTTFEKNVML